MFEDPRHFHFRLATGAILSVVILPSLRVITRLLMRCQVSEGSEQRSNPTHMMGNPPLRLARTGSGDFKTSTCSFMEGYFSAHQKEILVTARKVRSDCGGRFERPRTDRSSYLP